MTTSGPIRRRARTGTCGRSSTTSSAKTDGRRRCSAAARSPRSAIGSTATCSVPIRPPRRTTPPPRRSPPSATDLPTGGKVHLSYGDEDVAEYVRQLAADHLIHAWDVAAATGGDTSLDPDVVDDVATWFAEREQLYRGAGIIGSPGRDDVGRPDRPSPRRIRPRPTPALTASSRRYGLVIGACACCLHAGGRRHGGMTVGTVGGHHIGERSPVWCRPSSAHRRQAINLAPPDAASPTACRPPAAPNRRTRGRQHALERRPRRAAPLAGPTEGLVSV